jgi:hypothetical protein
MKKLLLILSLTFPFTALCQDDKEIFKRFTFDIKAGAAIPLGAYANSSTDQLIRENPSDPNREVVGVFTKNGNGFAKPGYFYEGNLGYRFGKHIFGGVFGQRFTNPINLEPVNFFLKEINPEFDMSQNDYKGRLIGPLIGVGKSNGLFHYSISQSVGSAKMDFPIFEMAYGEDIPWVFTHFGDYEPIETWFSKTELILSYQLSPWMKLGGNISFIYADFDYSLNLANVPGGSGFYQCDDTVNLRLLNLGLHLGIEF